MDYTMFLRLQEGAFCVRPHRKKRHGMRFPCQDLYLGSLSGVSRYTLAA